MSHPFYEIIKETKTLGIHLAFTTSAGGFHPFHWHDEVEILYLLNGQGDIIINNQKYKLPKRQVIVIDSKLVHSTFTYNAATMFVCIHLSKTKLLDYLPDAETYMINCIPESISNEMFPKYLEICELAENIVRLYMNDSPFFTLESEGIVLQMFAKLLSDFSSRTFPKFPPVSNAAQERIREIISYVETHYMENISLSDIALHLGLTEEYFCRFFKKNMGISFLEYLGEIRSSHVYHELLHTDKPIAAIMEENGFSNQKHFNQTFKKIYHCTPSSIRRTKS